MNRYRFHFGNSVLVGLAFELSVIADSKAEAVRKVREQLSEQCDSRHRLKVELDWETFDAHLELRPSSINEAAITAEEPTGVVDMEEKPPTRISFDHLEDSAVLKT